MKQEAYLIKEMHTINMRRYWSGDHSRSLGCHIFLLANNVEIATNWRENFWEYARTIHESLRKLMKEHSSLKQNYINSKLRGCSFEALSLERISGRDYSSSNMGNLDSLVSTDTKHVRITHLVRTVGNSPDGWQHNFHTFHGQLNYSLCYSCHLVTEQTARHFVDQLFKNLESVI